MDEPSISLLNSLDLSSIQDLDPSIADGHRVVYDREVPFELRTVDSNEGTHDVGTLESIKTKVLIMGDEHNPTSVRVEVSSENDLFFHYQHAMDEIQFRSVSESQKLMVDFHEYANLLMRMLNNCIKEPHSHLAIFMMLADGKARLDFIQNMEYKFVELLSLEFGRSPEDIVRSHISYRYNSMKGRLALMQARLQDVNALVKIKNPSLLLQLQRTPPRKPGSRAGFS
mmetsp:Transcript_31656/g.53439  ORF Transcript_31656/g.53439 Transcript_31656/m.53439 type:complete len:227 (+) Transcript_31656:205-885(+)